MHSLSLVYFLTPTQTFLFLVLILAYRARSRLFLLTYLLTYLRRHKLAEMPLHSDNIHSCLARVALAALYSKHSDGRIQAINRFLWTRHQWRMQEEGGPCDRHPLCPGVESMEATPPIR